jgi:LysM repeat protein
VQDEDIFILGDDEDDEDEAHELASVSLISEPTPPAYQLASSSSSSLTNESIPIAQTNDTHAGHAEVTVTGEQHIPSRYYINSRDTLQGIALRYGVNVRYAVRINGHH